MVSYKNILVIQTAFIGDAILASSLIEKLHYNFPDSKISVLVRKGNEELYENHPYLKEVLVWDKQESKIKNLFLLLFQIRREKFDCVINCHRFASSGILAGLSGARHIAGYKQNSFSFLFDSTTKHSLRNGLHEIERYNQLIEDFTDKKIFKPKLYPSKKDFKKIEVHISQAFVCIAPASVWLTKQLPKNKWSELIQKIEPTKKIFLLGSKNDFEFCEQIKTESKSIQVENLSGKLTLLQTTALISKAQMNYLNDSAVLHLASAVNAPTTAFFLSTIPEFGFGPLSDNNKIFQVKNLPCKPCGVHGYKACPQQHFKCANQIEIEP